MTPAIAMLRENLAKAGEGSRGGHIIGHSTSTGKPIYESDGPTKQQLHDAADDHERRAADYGKRAEAATGEHKAALRDMQRDSEATARKLRTRAGSKP